MIDTIDMMISLVFECIIFIYYTNSTMQPRKKLMKSNCFSIIGYVFLYIVSLYNFPLMNVISFVAVNFVMIYLLFDVKIKNAIIQTVILTAVMMFSECIMSMLTDVSSEVNCFEGKTFSVRMLHAVLSKMIYFMGIVIVKFISRDKSEYKNANGFLSLIIVPIFTILSIADIMSVFQYINEEKRIGFVFLSIFGIAANIIIYWMYDKTLQYHEEIRELQQQKFENDLELNYCNMLEDKLQQTKLMRHDFKEHLRILETYINSDNGNAIDYLKSIKLKNDEIEILNYTNNKVLNILLSEKQKICASKEIDLKIHTSDIDFDFMKDIDIVSIFSNLLNNAIESSVKSNKKIIYINLYKMNKSFLVIKIDNSCDQKPVEKNGFYQTTKISDGEHGIGLKSVAKTLKNYNGDLRLQYNIEDKIFSAMIMIPLIN